MTTPLKAPFPYFGGKSSIAPEIWSRFGSVRNYVEPFAGSAAMLLARPKPWDGTETINDADGMVSNFWRALQHDPDAVAHHADWPVNEADLTARHIWLVNRRDSLTERLMADPDWFDPKAAGWWVWGMCCWIGGGFCSGKGSWTSLDGKIVKTDNLGVKRKMVHLGDAGKGVNRKVVHLGNPGQGVNRQVVNLRNAGMGVNRSSLHASNPADAIGQCQQSTENLTAYMRILADRLRLVRVCCGDWSRVCGPSPTVALGTTAVFLDPPYSTEAGRDPTLYASEDLSVAHAAREWALQQGQDPRMRIALCGYEGEHPMPDSWDRFEWKANGGYSSLADDDDSQGKLNSRRERVYFSPHCPKPAAQLSLF